MRCQSQLCVEIEIFIILSNYWMFKEYTKRAVGLVYVTLEWDTWRDFVSTGMSLGFLTVQEIYWLNEELLAFEGDSCPLIESRIYVGP